MPDFNRNVLAGLAVAALVALAFAAGLWWRGDPPVEEVNAAEAAKQDIEAMYREDLAAARAQAQAKEDLRKLELEAAEEALNKLEAEPALPPVLEEDLVDFPADAVPPAADNSARGVNNVLSREVYTRGDPGGEAGNHSKTE